MEQHPAPAAKHFNIAFVLQRKTWEYFISERFLAANPGHKTIYFFTSLHLIFADSVRHSGSAMSAHPALFILANMIHCTGCDNSDTSEHKHRPTLFQIILIPFFWSFTGTSRTCSHWFSLSAKGTIAYRWHPLPEITP